MSDSIKKILGLKDDVKVNELSGAKILKAAMKKGGKLSRKVIIEFNGHEITDEDKKSIACELINGTNIGTMNEFMDALNKELNKSSIKKRKVNVYKGTNDKTPNTINSTTKNPKKQAPKK